MTDKQINERLADRRDYRQALIERREEIEKKIVTVEKQIKELRPPVERDGTTVLWG